MDQQLLGLLEKGSLRREAWEIKTIQDIATQIFVGVEVTRAQLGTGNYPAVKCGDVNSKLNICFDECVSFVDEGLLQKRKYFEYGDVLVSNLGDIKTAGSTSVYLGSKKCLAGSDVTVIKHNQNPRYLAYILSAEFCRKQIAKSLITGSTVIHLYASKIKQIQIPLPPRPIQDLIAEVLDKWTHLQEELARELARELECRKKQYLYYKERLLSKDIDKWEIKTLEEIADRIDSGSGIKKDQLRTQGYPAVRYSEIHSANLFINKCKNLVDPDLIPRKKYCEFGDLLITKVSEDIDNAGKAVAFLDEKAMIGDAIFAVKHRQNPKFMSYVLSSGFCRSQIQKAVPRGIVMNFKKSHLCSLLVPLPPIEEQEKIVSLLDPLHEMCGDAEKGIPALISVLQKQYQHYKEELLKF